MKLRASRQICSVDRQDSYTFSKSFGSRFWSGGRPSFDRTRLKNSELSSEPIGRAFPLSEDCRILRTIFRE